MGGRKKKYFEGRWIIFPNLVVFRGKIFNWAHNLSHELRINIQDAKTTFQAKQSLEFYIFYYLLE